MQKSGIGAAIFLFLPFFLVASLLLTTRLHAQSPFYQGKSINLIIGNQAGGQYDLWARHIANHIGKQIPGNPNVVVQNMPAAGSLVAANYLYNVAKPDGLTIGAVIPGIYTDQLIGRKEVQFDWAKFSWIGTPEQTEWLFITPRIVLTKASTIYAQPQSHLNAAPQGRARLYTKYLNFWKRSWE
jgi:tripartite-type tricarboxylate transporter receptor subunit TctC